MKKQLMMAAMALTLCACGGGTSTSDNPFFKENYGTPHEIPPFEQITVAHYREAMLKGLEEERAEIQKIIDNTEAPTFDNTIAAMDQSGKLLNKVMEVFFSISSSNTNDEIDALQMEIMPQMAELSNFINMNDKLFQRVKAVYDARETLGLDKEQLRLLTETYKGFVRNGAALGKEQKEQLAKINTELSVLQVQFEQNLTHETNETYVTVDTKEELEGLPESNIEAAAKMAAEKGQEGKYMFNMQRPSCNPVLQYCKNRDVRKRVYEAYYNRGNQGNQWDNKEISRKILQLRLQKAKLLGFENPAMVALDNRMAKSTDAVYNLLDQVWKPAVEKAKEELDDIRAEIRKEGGNFEPEGWDFRYYQDKAKQAKFNVDETKVAEYLQLDNVQKGVFWVANKLYGLTFVERTNEYPSYEPTAKAWDVIDKDGQLLAIFYSDYFPRAGKGAGAWCGGFRSQSYDKDGKRIVPIVTNVCNMTMPSGDKPALQTLDNVETIFHEFGHALDGFMTDVHYQGTANTETDFVELPSQINEHWAFEPEVLNFYAKHYQTGEVIPMELLKKVEESSKYGQGFATVEYLAASLVDIDLHTLTDIPDDFDVMQFEQQKLAERGIPSQIFPRYRVTNFSHTMGGGYTAGYYSYMWAEVLDCDAFEAYKEAGNIFDQEIAERFRKTVLTPGGIDDGMTMYKNFRGREPKIDALLEKRGLKNPSNTLRSKEIEKK